MVSTDDGIRPDGEQAFHCALATLVGPLEQDLLANYTFPGGGRIDNLIYTIERTDVEPMCGGANTRQNAVLFMSLLQNGSVEVRMLGGNGTGDDSTQDASCSDRTAPVSHDLYGFFSLSCG